MATEGLGVTFPFESDFYEPTLDRLVGNLSHDLIRLDMFRKPDKDRLRIFDHHIDAEERH
jgi:hypothetical protein